MSVLNSHALAVDRLHTELLKGVAAGSREQFSLLYHQLHKPLLRLVYRYTQCQEFIDALVEETFAIIWKSPLGCHDGVRVVVWVMSLASQRARLASESKYGYFSNKSNCQTFAGSDKTVSLGRSHDIEWVIGQMDVIGRVTVELAYYHGFSVGEIATVLDCSESVAKGALSSSQERLYEFLSERADVLSGGQKVEGPQ
ncbi:MAG: RNA polymerase sigma-70 factor (ECF subfamily) [Gammaproteobacteria bacterium]|jgi:RNA polymerase sigma-70 factor (ECF subfamily)